MRIVLDTGVLLAAVLPRDPDHAAAVRILHRLADGEWSAAVTTDFVLAEAFDFLRMKARRRETAEALAGLVFGLDGTPPVVDAILRIHAGRFASALERYRREFDRGLSLTDWTTVVAAEDAGVARVATFDRAFGALLPVVDGQTS